MSVGELFVLKLSGIWFNIDFYEEYSLGRIAYIVVLLFDLVESLFYLENIFCEFGFDCGWLLFLFRMRLGFFIFLFNCGLFIL